MAGVIAPGSRLDPEAQAQPVPGGPPTATERLQRLFDYLRAVRAIFDRPTRDVTASAETLLWEEQLAAEPGATVGPSPDALADDGSGSDGLGDEPWLVVRRQAQAGPAPRLYREMWDLALRLGQDEATLELVWGHGVLGWGAGGERLLHPLLVTPMLIEVDPDRGEVRVRPSAPASLEVEFLDGLGLPGLEALTDRRDRLREEPIDPWDAERARELYAYVGNVLRADLEVLDGGQPPPAGHEPVVAATSILYVRRRAVSYRRFFERAADALAEGGLPDGPLTDLVDPSDQPAGPVGEGGRLLMPLATNAEQEEIGRRLASHRGVTVQGPPGTGKTHTIANLISHLMAQGRRVLVTSHKEQPLEVLRGMLPERIRPLCVSLLGVGAGELGQLDQSVQAILRETGTLDPERAGWAVEQAVAELDRVDAEVAYQRAELARRAELERSRFEAEDRPRSVAEVGRWLAGADPALRFVPDQLGADDQLPLSGAELAELYQLATAVSAEDRAKVVSRRPEVSALPDGEALRSLLDTVAAAEAALAELAGEHEQSRIPASMSSTGLDAIAGRVDEMAAAMERADVPWVAGLCEELRRSAASRAAWQRLVAFVEGTIAELYELNRRTGPHDLVVPGNVPPRQLADRLGDLRAYVAGGQAVDRRALRGRRDLATLVRQVRIDGGQATSVEDVDLLLAVVAARRRRGELVTAWNRQMSELGGPTVDPADPRAEAAVERALNEVREAIAFETSLWPAFRDRLRWSGLNLSRTPNRGDLDAISADVELARALVERQRAERRARSESAAAHSELARVRAALAVGRRRSGASPLWVELEDALAAGDAIAWDDTLAEAARLDALEPQVRRLDGLAGRLRALAPLWTERIVTAPRDAGDPALAAEAWRLRQAETWLDRLVAAGDASGIQERLDELTVLRQHQVDDLVAWSTWLAVAERVTDEQRRALNGWVQAVRRIGKGTGRHANRYRAIAREQMDRCRDAVPVWIMPTWRVVETFEPGGDPFDVVIVDESSQCDLFSLGVLALGRQVIVVGDDNQISPTLFTDQGAVHRLIEAHIADLPNAKLLDTTASLYDVAKWAFPGVVMLREHFRCLPEIIAFSNQLMYEGEILPLREEPDDPSWEPVRTTAVPHGERSLGVNEAEAGMLADAVVACCADPAYAGRSMGVISLMGEVQARHIQHLLLERLGEREYAARRIKCGDAYRFQGDERDVMFLSMVVASGDRQAALTRLADRQRINVAASRARDQVWLFHSVQPGELHRDDARTALLRWCLDRSGAGQVERSEPFTSPLERAVQKALQARGFRVRSQVRVGHHRIDLVVAGGAEGGRGRRLAVECAGEARPALGRFERDERAQLVLERLGWRFHRVRASAWYRDPEAALAALLERLAELGVQPAEAAGFTQGLAG